MWKKGPLSEGTMKKRSIYAKEKKKKKNQMAVNVKCIFWAAQEEFSGGVSASILDCHRFILAKWRLVSTIGSNTDGWVVINGLSSSRILLWIMSSVALLFPLPCSLSRCVATGGAGGASAAGIGIDGPVVASTTVVIMISGGLSWCSTSLIDVFWRLLGTLARVAEA